MPLLRSVHKWLIALAVMAAFLPFQTASSAVLLDPGVISPTGEPPLIQPMYTGCSAVYLDAFNNDYEQQVVELVNQRRAENNLPPLKRVVALDYAARYHAKDMMDENYFEHNSYDRQNGALVAACSWDTRIDHFYTSNYLGENIAAGYASPATAMTGWMESDGHRKNILSPNYREIGVGYASGGSSQYRHYWVQDFGASSYPVIINREDAKTDVPQVELYIYGQGTFTEMRLRNDTEAWTSWQPFQTSLAWNLSLSAGTRKVTVELRKSASAASQVVSSSDTIDLTMAGYKGPVLGNLPESIKINFNQEKGTSSPAVITLNPQNITGTGAMEWEARAEENWLHLSPTTGTSPDDLLTLTLDDSILQTPGSYTGHITFWVTGETDLLSQSKVVQVNLSVVESMPYALYLSTLLH